MLIHSLGDYFLWSPNELAIKRTLKYAKY